MADNAQLNSLAAAMRRAMAREGGSAGRYDAARQVFFAKERQLLNRIACGSARAHEELSSLRKSPLYFPQSFKGPR